MLGRQVRQVRQVLRVYTTYPSLWAWVFLWMLFHLPYPFVLGGDRLEWFPIAFINAMIGFGIGSALANQFANPRARLMPQFAKSHLLVAGGLVTLAVSSDVTLALLFGGTAFGMFSLSIGAVGLGVLGAVNQGRMKLISTMLCIAVVVLFFAAPNLDESPSLRRLGSDPLFHAVFGCLGLVAMAAAGIRLVNLSEDSPGYPALHGGLGWDTEIGTPTGRRQRQQAERIAPFPSGRTRRDILFNIAFRHMPRPGRWRRALLRQVADGVPVLSILTLQAVFFGLIFWIRGTRGDLLQGGGPILMCLLPFLAAIILSSHSWTIRRNHLARESLLPVGRKDFVRDMARATAFEMCVAAAAHCLLIVVALALFANPMPRIGFIAAWLALTVAQYFVGFSLMSWLSAFRSSWRFGWVLLMVVIYSWIPGIAAAILAVATRGGSLFGGTLTLLGVAAIASISFSGLAWYEWRQIDFD